MDGETLQFCFFVLLFFNGFSSSGFFFFKLEFIFRLVARRHLIALCLLVTKAQKQI